jgi:hypothetical protein
MQQHPADQEAGALTLLIVVLEDLVHQVKEIMVALLAIVAILMEVGVEVVLVV